MPNVYRIVGGQVESQFVPDWQTPYYLGNGWVLTRPGPPVPLNLPNQGQPGSVSEWVQQGVGNLVAMGTQVWSNLPEQERVAALWKHYLNTHMRGSIPVNYQIVKVEPSPTAGPSGLKRWLVTWTSAQQYGNPIAYTTDEVTMVPPREGGPTLDWQIVPSYQEPQLELPELHQEDDPSTPFSEEAGTQGELDVESIYENDEEVARIFSGLSTGTINISEGLNMLSQHLGGWGPALEMMEYGFTVAAAATGIPLESLPRLEDYTVFQIPQLLRDLQSAFDPRLLAGTTAAGGTTGTDGTGLSGEGIPGIDFSTGNPLTDALIAMGFGNLTGSQQVYEAPDPNTVRDNMRSLMVSLTGTTDSARVEQLTSLYLQVHRMSYDGLDRDPQQVVLNTIRAYPEYQQVHALRPDFVDEMDWLAYQYQGLMNSGMRNSAVAQRAITQAIVGTQPALAGEAGQLYELQETGRPLPGFLDNLHTTMSNIMRLMG